MLPCERGYPISKSPQAVMQKHCSFSFDHFMKLLEISRLRLLEITYSPLKSLMNLLKISRLRLFEIAHSPLNIY